MNKQQIERLERAISEWSDQHVLASKTVPSLVEHITAALSDQRTCQRCDRMESTGK